MDALSRLHDAVERIGATLLAFDADATVVLLDAAPLSGTTAARWREARATVAVTYLRFRALGDVLERAAHARGPARAALLDEPSVVVVGGDLAVGDRGLLDRTTRTTRWRPDELLTAMTDDFDAARRTVAAIAQAWDTGRARVAALRARPDVGTVAAELDAVAAAIVADPLADDLGRRLDELDRLLTDIARLRDDAVAQLDAARRRLAVAGGGATVTAELDAIVDLVADGNWADAASRLDAWWIDVAAEHDREAARQELVGRVRAYAAKADRLGLLEVPAVVDAHGEARVALAARPVDLELAAVRVAEYQHLVNTVQPLRRGEPAERPS